jgi:hypothetical protein
LAATGAEATAAASSKRPTDSLGMGVLLQVLGQGSFESIARRLPPWREGASEVAFRRCLAAPGRP